MREYLLIMKNNWSIFKFFIENIPNIGFWLGLLYYARNWYTQQPWLIKYTFLSLPVVFLLLTGKSIISKTQTEIRRKNLDKSIEKHANSVKGEISELLKKTVPTTKELKGIYRYADSYASSWAKDGELRDLTLFFHATNRTNNLTITLHISSELRGESLRVHLPKNKFSDDIVEEGSVYLRRKDLFPVKQIFLYKEWRKAIEIAIENSISDISKANEVTIQVGTYRHFGINFYLKKANREWSKRYKLEDRKLLTMDGLSIYTF